MKLWPKSLFGRTAITITLTLLSFTLVSMGAAVYFILIPMAKRSADDFASVIVSAAHALQDAPQEQHEQLHKDLLTDHGLIVTTLEPGLSETDFHTPYLRFFRDSLTRAAGEELPIIESNSGPLVWVDVPAHEVVYRIGFNRERLGTNPPVAIAAIILGGALLVTLVSLVEVRRVVKPLDRLSAAVRKVGTGQYPRPVAADGPEEIADLARTINRMSADLRELAENRTVMISGISHDLRTPLTRLGIAVEMLDENSRPELVAGIRRDLEAMNRLISQFLEFSKDAEEACPVQVDLWKIIESMAGDLEREGAVLHLHRMNPPCVFFADPVALERVLANLLRNAAQASDGKPIDVKLRCSDLDVSIEVCDRGPGIPETEIEAVFRPFHRLDKAREIATGGCGLGLAISRQLANKHDWTLELLPREGGGTIARLGLPATCRFALAS